MNNKKHSANGLLLQSLVDELLRGIALIDSLNDELYQKSNQGIGSIGAHIRHNHDFVSNFLAGIEAGEIDYNSRERELRIEEDRTYASERLQFLVIALRGITAEDHGRGLVVLSEVDEVVRHRSTLSRELEFVHSHTVHHYALIAEKLRSYGVEFDEDLGVAPSTLKYWNQEFGSKRKVA